MNSWKQSTTAGMKLIALTLALRLLATGLFADENNALFAAFAMTKAQEASSLPTDSGIFIRESALAEWERVGPVIQTMNSFAVDPSNRRTLFIACGNGIVRSLDSGESWRMVTGWRESDFTQIAIDPENGQNVYAASLWGLHASYDGGESWQRANKGLAKRYSRVVVVDEKKPKRLLLGTEDGIYVSQDRAKSWERILSSPKKVILSLSRSRIDSSLWVAGTEGNGVYLSEDNGSTWKQVADALAKATVYAVTVDPFDAQAMAAATWGQGLWISRDRGETWNRTEARIASPNLTAATFDPGRPSRLWTSTFEEGTYYSDDYGTTWQDGGLHGAYVWDLGFVPAPASQM